MSAARLVKRAKKKAAKKAAEKARARVRQNSGADAVAKTVSGKRDAPQNVDRRKVEPYLHKGKDATRLNNPPAGIAHMGDGGDGSCAIYDFDPNAHPELRWHDKIHRDKVSVPIIPIHTHEHVDPHVIIEPVLRKNGNGQDPLLQLEDPLPLERAVEFYKHQKDWTNRLIAGDSLLVMNSLLQKESMAGKVQCVYMDPPYGIKYGSNFQPFVGKRDVKDGHDADLTTEPEMIHAFRDTWEKGIHSYLHHLRDRLVLCRELLTESGSCFVQISDENVHLVRALMDEVFGAANVVAMINFRRKVNPMNPKYLGTVNDYLLFYAKNKEQVKFRKIYEAKKPALETWNYVELPSGRRRRLTREEMSGDAKLPQGARVFGSFSMSPAGFNANATFNVSLGGKEYKPPITGGRRSWKTNREGMERLVSKKRVMPQGETLRYVSFFDDFPYSEISHSWEQPFFASDKRYVVETGVGAIQRCLLMATDPGDLVFDPTCGSGTTAFAAEQWGRRWITCDTSRVALTIARQRLMTAHFPYYKLTDKRRGVDGGFVCKRVPHVTLKSIANNSPPKMETLHDQPEVDRKKARVTGPFTVDALPAPVVVSPEEIVAGMSPRAKAGANIGADAGRERETRWHGVWRNELAENGIRLKGGKVMKFSSVETFPNGSFLHLEVETEGKNPERGFVSFGPEHTPIGRRQVELALEEAGMQHPHRPLLVFAAFEFDPEAAKMMDEVRWKGVSVEKAKMDPDLHVQDLKRKKRQAGDAAFWMMGRPDVELRPVKGGEWIVKVRGFDYYDPRVPPSQNRLISGGEEQIAVWMLDTNYNGRELRPCQVFFPMKGKGGWDKLERELRAELDEERMEKYRGTESLPFNLGGYQRVAVKIVDDSGIESLRILRPGKK